MRQLATKTKKREKEEAKAVQDEATDTLESRSGRQQQQRLTANPRGGETRRNHFYRPAKEHEVSEFE